MLGRHARHSSQASRHLSWRLSGGSAHLEKKEQIGLEI